MVIKSNDFLKKKILSFLKISILDWPKKNSKKDEKCQKIATFFATTKAQSHQKMCGNIYN